MDFEERLRKKNGFDGNLIYGAKEFTKITGRDRYLESLSSPLINEDTGLLKGEASRFRPCPLCDSDLHETKLVKDGFSHVRCLKCGLFFVNPILKEEYVKKFYREKRSWHGVLQNEVQVRLDKLKFNYGLDVLALYGLKPPARILDVGAGLGHFLEVARERGFEAMGVEIDEDFVAQLRAKGFPVLDRPLRLEEKKLGRFNLITVWELLEHLTKPRETLGACFNLLKKGGLLYVVVPNLKSLALRILHEKSITFAGHAHINFFTRETLEELLKKTGFELMETETIFTELGVINNYLNFENPYLGEGGGILELLTPAFIHKNLLGSRLACVARKP